MDGIKKGDTVIIVAPGVRAEWASCEQRFKDNKVGNEGNDNDDGKEQVLGTDVFSDALILGQGYLNT